MNRRAAATESQPQPPTPLNVKQAQELMRKQLGAAPSNSAMYRLLHNQEMVSIKVAGKVLITEASVLDFISFARLRT
jgi:hypothetical protein